MREIYAGKEERGDRRVPYRDRAAETKAWRPESV